MLAPLHDFHDQGDTTPCDYITRTQAKDPMGEAAELACSKRD